MDKNNPLKQNLLSKTNIAVVLALGMLAGFLLERAWLSFFVFAFGVNSLWNVHPKRWFKEKFWMVGFAWVTMYAISYLWSDDKFAWEHHYTVKAPVLLLPLAFALLPAFSVKQLRVFTLWASVIMLAGVAYSLQFFIRDPSFYAEQYVYSHVLPTPAECDHIRFSLSVVLFIIWAIYAWPMLNAKWQRWFMGFVVVVFSIYLHILAARTGLALWYLFVLCWIIRYAIRKKAAVGFGMLAGLVLATVVAVNYIPTLEKRVWYFKETIQRYNRGEVKSDYSDMGRLISYKIAGAKIAQHPILGVGSGDMYTEMVDGYKTMYPDVPEEYRLLPHNQFFIVMLAAGIVALVLFLLWVLMPLAWLKDAGRTFYLFMVWFSLVLTLLIEPVFEVQFGVFVYLFFLLWQKHALRTQENRYKHD